LIAVYCLVAVGGVYWMEGTRLQKEVCRLLRKDFGAARSTAQDLGFFAETAGR